ncbi:MAG: hypothetical protein MJZ45_01165 [Bacteroidales bacterium]|nr:hypothetical protein [Bacteroidales bacterium]
MDKSFVTGRQPMAKKLKAKARDKEAEHELCPRHRSAQRMLNLRRTLLLHSICIATGMLCHSNAVAMW